MRPDSVVATRFADWARNQGCDVACQAEAVSLEMDLPPTWEEYLAALSTKQRHEVGRKLRRLAEMGNTGYRSILDRTAALTAMEIFVKLFSESRRDKAAFMTSRMESFFKAIAAAMVDAGLLRLGVLELDTVPTAMIMCFDLNGTVYLYNSGYDPQYAYLSPGLLSKVSCIKDSIEKGRKRFDFLKGSETYKYHLGGKEVPLYAYQIAIR